MKFSGESIFQVMFNFLMFLCILFYILLSEIEFCLHLFTQTITKVTNYVGLGSDFNTENQTQRNGVNKRF